MKSFIRTDLACEREGDLRRRELTVQGCRVCEVRERRDREWVSFATVHFSSLGETGGVLFTSSLITAESTFGAGINEPAETEKSCLASLK